jgi:hypothetical protein
VSEEDKARHNREMNVFNSFSSAVSYPTPTSPVQVSGGVESVSSCQKYTAVEGIDCAASNHCESDGTPLITGMAAGIVMNSKAKRAKKTIVQDSSFPKASNDTA